MALQAGKIKSLFPGASVTFDQKSLTWKYSVVPSPLSNEYQIKLSYQRGDHPNVYVLSPTLPIYPGESKLQHVYDTEKQWLCLYYRKGHEWKSNMLIADTVIPWTCEWLLHYECWMATGVWHGGGIHASTENEKQEHHPKKNDI
jgi:hypothetical protein